MKRTIYYITGNSNSFEAYQNQAESLFPFLNSPLLYSTAKQQIKFKDIHASLNARNIKAFLPHKKPCQEFIFFGRSNVGKSTLLNNLLQQPIAAMSKRPGKTKQLLFCELMVKKLTYLVDAPGYGFATGVSKSEISQWGKLITSYLKLTAENIQNQKILCLLDPSHGLKETDALLFQLLKDFKKEFILIFTKCDRMSEKDFTNGLQTAELLREKYGNMSFYVHFTSSLSMKGIDQLRNHLMFQVVNKYI